MAGYCLSCGRLRELNGGLCGECRADEAVREASRRSDRIARTVARWRREADHGVEREAGQVRQGVPDRS